MNGGNRFPFTASQWQELEHQALFFKYMISGIPIPPDLLFSIKRSCLDPNKLFSRPPQSIGWNCLQMGLGRKVDPEPGRCRRTDGKKWRCSKEAYQDSKYCERHMHRGKNRSRKPVEAVPAAATAKNHLPPPHHLQQYPFLYQPPTSRVENPTHPLLDSHFSTTNTNYRRSGYGDEHVFFSESSGSSMRSFSEDSSWNLTPLTMSSSSSKQRSSEHTYLQLHNNNEQEQLHFSVLGTEIKAQKMEKNPEPQKTMHHFFDELPPNHKDSWLDLDNKASRSNLSFSIFNNSKWY